MRWVPARCPVVERGLGSFHNVINIESGKVVRLPASCRFCRVIQTCVDRVGFVPNERVGTWKGMHRSEIRWFYNQFGWPRP